ncbi:hypothetical protein SK128_000001 [Halocaridina rubra]|uniref:Uncharacterized protein n=1 Tax=Halocaridina rubra TaxID=373956 RepID=A0AAN8WPV0_HALRR
MKILSKKKLMKKHGCFGQGHWSLNESHDLETTGHAFNIKTRVLELTSSDLASKVKYYILLGHISQHSIISSHFVRNFRVSAMKSFLSSSRD